MLTMCTTKNPDDTETRTIAYGTGNWRKDHMRETIAPFQRALFTKKIDFQLLPGSLEAKYGGISTLKLVAFEEYLEVLPFQYFWHCLP